MTVRSAVATEALITGEMAYRIVRRESGRGRFEVGVGGAGTFIDVIEDPAPAARAGGIGTIHHVAWRVPGDEEQYNVRERLTQGGISVPPVRDRTYLRPIYYPKRGVLFEIATDVPGFAVDETPGSLGTALKLPAPFESDRLRNRTKPPAPAASPHRRAEHRALVIAFFGPGCLRGRPGTTHVRSNRSWTADGSSSRRLISRTASRIQPLIACSVR